MAGIRIHHVNKRACTLDVPHMERTQAEAEWRPTQWDTPKVRPKVYRINLDSEGDALVSPVVWQRLQEAYQLLGHCPFIVLNEVQDPPTLYLGKR